MSTQFYQLIKVATATTGTGTVTGGAAVAGYQTAASAGMVTGETGIIKITDGAAYEFSTTAYNSTGPTYTRVLIGSSTGSLLNLSGTGVIVEWVPAAADMNACLRFDETQSLTAIQRAQANANLANPSAAANIYLANNFGGL